MGAANRFTISPPGLLALLQALAETGVNLEIKKKASPESELIFKETT
tara:strand:+ start:336 stop:476 length:141 start_codon:yes stop_codon:yes gene_type:complete